MNTTESQEQLRLKIDQIDQLIIYLCSQRIQLAQKIFSLKHLNQQPFIDENREQEICAAFEADLSDLSTPERILNFTRALIQLNPFYPLFTKVDSHDSK